MIPEDNKLWTCKDTTGLTVTCIGARRKDIVEILRRDLLTLCAGINFCYVGTYNVTFTTSASANET